MSSRTALVLLAAAATLGLPVSAVAAPPRVLHLQGTLADSGGVAIDHQFVAMRIAVFDDVSSTPCFEETVSVPVKHGFFTLGVGRESSGISPECSFHRPSYLEISIRAADGTWDSPMSPRIPLTAVATSVTTERLDVAAHDSAFPSG